MALLKLALAGAAGFAFYKFAMKKTGERAALAAGEGASLPDGYVRNAGPEAMRDKPESWSKTDQEIDESFPASDPAANY